MPIFVQWKWQEESQTLLLILHFDADGSEANLRNSDMTFAKYTFSDDNRQDYYPSQLPMDICQPTDELKKATVYLKRRQVATWAPSHVEIGLMAELLCYANMINGLKPHQRNELRPKLDIMCNVLEYAKLLRLGKIGIGDESLKKNTVIAFANLELLKKATNNEAYLVGCDYNYGKRKCENVFCSVLSPEYIDYLKRLLKPYLR